MASYSTTIYIEEFPLIGNEGAVLDKLEIDATAYGDDIECVHWERLRICAGEADITLDPRINGNEPLYRLIAAQLNTEFWQNYLAEHLSEAMAKDGVSCGSSYADEHRLSYCELV